MGSEESAHADGWIVFRRRVLLLMASFLAFALGACGSEVPVPVDTSSESASFEPAIGPVEDVFDYVDPMSGEDATIPGVSLDQWVAELESVGVNWLEQGSFDGTGYSRWLGIIPSGLTAVAMADDDGALIEISCTGTEETNADDSIKSISHCYQVIDTPGFDSDEVSEWIATAVPEMGSDVYVPARFQVFGPVWLMLTAPSGDGRGDSLTVVLRRSS